MSQRYTDCCSACTPCTIDPRPQLYTTIMTSSNSPKQQNLPFLLGAGLGRTGTHSLQAALTRLGYNKPFHMKEILEGRAPAHGWFELAKQERSTGIENKTMALELAQSILDLGYTAVTDYPTCLLLEQFLELRPDAKVILTVRTSAAEWRLSVSETIGIITVPLKKPPFSFSPFFQSFAHQLDPWLWERTFIAELGQIDTVRGESVMSYEEDMERGYDQWMEHVKATVPAEKLLIHHVSEGYAPICQHLGISNREDCPHLGDTEELKQLIKLFHFVNMGFLVVLGVLIFLLLLLGKRKMGAGTTSEASPKKKN